MDTLRICKQCRKPVPETAPEGLCPECLAKVALGSEPSAPGPRTLPEPKELAAQFPQLEILELLGMGGMGTVYKARQLRLDRLAALKILPIHSSPDPSFSERFTREARALARLNHPGIVTIYDFGQTEHYYYFIMEYVDGMNLRQLIQSKTLEPRQALELIAQICAALQFAHDEKIVHRDIKPENILITKKGQVKIADFGLAKLLGGQPDTGLTASQMVMGTFNYMAPEQREKPLEVDHRADIYSLGVVFYEMLTGEVPMGRFDAPSKKVQVDVRLDEVVLHALEREPARRYQQVSEIRSNVENITSTAPSAGAPSAAKKPAAPAKGPSPLRRLMGILLLCLCFELLFHFMSSSGRKNGAWWLVSLLEHGWPIAFFLVVMAWVIRLSQQGIRYRDLPPALKRKLHFYILGLLAVTSFLFFILFSFFPIRITDSKEWMFIPKSGAYAKLGFTGEFTHYNQAIGHDYYAAPNQWKVALAIYTTNRPPAVMNITLPDLRAEYGLTNVHGGLMRSVLDKEVLTLWLRDGAMLDTARPKLPDETGEIMALLKSFENAAPHTAEEFANLAKADLNDFYFGGYTSNTSFNTMFMVFVVLSIILLSGYFVCAAWMVRHVFSQFKATQDQPAPTGILPQ